MKPPLQPAVVLVADPTLSARYRVLFEGVFATAQTTQVPEWMMRRFLAPPARANAAGRARTAPLGLRRVEAALLDSSALGPDDVAVTTPQAVGRLLGPWTRVVGVSSSDPLGHGMSNTTTRAFSSGSLYTRLWTDRLMRRLAEARRRFGFRIAAGGAGAWQYVHHPADAARHGIDTVLEGYVEGEGPARLMAMVRGEEPPAHVRCRATAAGSARPIRGPSTMGVVELSRGCGNGCRFCLMADRRMEHLAEDTILADVETNVAAGAQALVSSSEDFFRYGAEGRRVRFERLRGLLERMQPVRRGALVQIGHANITSVLQLEVADLAEIRRLLAPDPDARHLWVNLGLESASGRLVAANGPGKIAPFDPDDWEAMALDAADRLRRGGFFPLFSVILGLPGETPDDLARTRRLVRRLDEGPAAVFPVFHEPVRPDRDGPAFALDDMTRRHLDLYAACYEINFRWIPRLYWDNQRAGGVSRTRRALAQTLGRAEIALWRRRFRHLRRTLEAAGPSRSHLAAEFTQRAPCACAAADDAPSACTVSQDAPGKPGG